MAENKPTAANKYSIYQQRDLESEMVDWGAIAQDINTGIKGVMADREARKDAITQTTQEALDKLNEVQDVDSTDIQSLLIDGSDNTKKALTEAHYLLTQGLMTEKDYALIVQQQKSGYSSLNTLAKNADAKFKDAMTRLAADCAKGPCGSAIEEWNNNTLLGFGNLKNTKLVSNPLTGELQLVRLIKNPNYVANSTNPGEMEKWIMPDPKTHPENYQSPNQMTKASTFKLDKVNSKDLAKAQTANVASIIDATISGSVLAGKEVTHLTNFKQIFDLDGGVTDENGDPITFDDFMNSQVDAVVGPATQTSNMNAAQILAQEMGYELGGSCDEVKARTNNSAFDCSKWIEVTNSSGTPVVTLKPAQQQAARDKVRMEMLVTLDNETKKTATAGQQLNKDPLRDKKNEEDLNRFSFIKQIDTMLGDSLTNANTEATNFVDMYNRQETDVTKHLRGIQVTEDELIIRRQSGEPYIIPRRYEDENGNIVNRSREEVISEAFNPLLGENVSKESITDIIKKQQYTFKGRREDIDDLNYRLKQSKLPPIVTKASEVTGGKQPKQYLRDYLYSDTTGDDSTRSKDTSVVAEKIKDVMKAVIPTGLIDMLVAEGYDNPLDTLEFVDVSMGQDQIKFTVAGEEFLITPAGYTGEGDTSIPGGQTGDNISSTAIYDEMLRVIGVGISKVEEKRRADKFTQLDDYTVWAAKQKDGEKGYKLYQEWKNEQRK